MQNIAENSFETISTELSGTFSLVINSGSCKNGKREPITHIDITAGESLAVVGPTGSGKSELLSDIEQMARGDTLSGRKVVFVNGASGESPVKHFNMVAQLTQRTGFVMDCDVTTFLVLHAQCRAKYDDSVVDTVIETANRLCGEPIGPDTGLQILSGGQARALMIADIAHISDAPIVLIDEIENAGIDKLAAMEVLSGSSKLVVISTHDPVLTLMASRRLVMKNGGMNQLLTTSQLESKSLKQLQKIDGLMAKTREMLRSGRTIEPEVLQP